MHSGGTDRSTNLRKKQESAGEAFFFAKAFMQTPALFDSVTMTSLELVDFINAQRQDGQSELRHDHFMAKVPKVLGSIAPNFSGAVRRPQPGGGYREYPAYRFPKREACLMAMSYSYELQAKVFDKMTELEILAKPPIPIIQLPDFNDPVAAARAWADEKEQSRKAQRALENAKPAIEFVDRFVDATGLKGFREVCKLLKANEARFREFVIGEKIMYRLAGTLTAHQNHIDAGRFEVRTGVAETEHAYTATKFTPKGVNWIAGEWAKYQLGKTEANA